MAEVTFSDWTERLKVYNDYIKALAEYKLNAAKAELEIAKAANVWATVRLKETIIAQLQRDLLKFNEARARHKREVESIRAKSDDASLLLGGQALPTNTFNRAWSSYVWFETRALPSSGDSLFDIAVPANARTVANFIQSSRTYPLIAAPDDVDNALILIDWMNDNRFIADRGRPAHRVISKLFVAINEVAVATITEIEKRMEEIRKKTFDTWKLPSLLGVSDDQTAKDVESAGSQ